MLFDPTVVVVFGTLFLALLASLLYAYWYQSLKHNARRRGADASQSLKISELEELIRAAVEEATEPLHARLESLQEEIKSLKTLPREEAEHKRLERREEQVLGLPGKE